MPKALFLSIWDWAGVGFYTSQAINNNPEWKCRHISFTHPGSYTRYPFDIIDPSFEEIENWYNWADCVVIEDGAETILPLTCKSKPIIQLFLGSWYRADPGRYNLLAKNRNRLTTTVSPDLVKFGPKFMFRTMEIIDHQTEKEQDFTVIHCPTYRAGKGTDRIIKELGSLENGITLKIIEGITNTEVMELKKKAHVLIDQVGPGLGGNGYATNSLEAWAVGIPVICDPNKDTLKSIINSIGYAPFLYPTGEETLASIATRLKDDHEYYENAVKIGQKYLRDFHSSKAVADRWIGVFEDSIKSFSPQPEGKKISVCMIVKNEKAKIGTALASIRGLADEVIVVDTGSTDNTVSLCKSMGCNVFEGYDNMHKANSRNSSMELASGEWTIILDADEEIVDPFGLRREINNAGPECISIAITAGSVMDFGSIPSFKFYQNRCWPKGNFKYSWRAHEVPNGKPELTGRTLNSEMVFAHYPDRSREHDAWKLQYTLDRLTLDVTEFPDSPRPRFYIGRQCMYLQRYGEAISSLLQYMEMTEMTGGWDRGDCCFHLYQCYHAMKLLPENEAMKGRYENLSIKYLYLACLEKPTNRKWFLDLGMFYYGRCRWSLVIGIMKCLLEIPENDQEGFRFSEASGSMPYDYIARSMWRLGRYEEGLEYAKMAVEKDPTDPRLKENLSFFVRKLEAEWRKDT